MNFIDNFDEFSFEELKDELKETLNISDTTPYHLQHEKKDHVLFKRKLGSKKSTTDGYNIILMGYARILFRHFERYLRIVVGLDEDDFKLILKQYHSNFFYLWIISS